MKRRAFLKTVGGVTGAAAMSAPRILAQTGTEKKQAGKQRARKAGKHGQTNTYGLSSLSSPDLSTPFSSLPVRLPGWFPDGADWGNSKHQRVFPEEVIGITRAGLQASQIDRKYDKGSSAQWILGFPIPKPAQGEKALTTLIRDLAVVVRKYNASLYRLRRLHFHWRYKNSTSGQVVWPDPNPPFDPGYPNPNAADFKKTVKQADAHWNNVNDQLNKFLDDAAEKGYPGQTPKVALIAADMVAVNGYIVSMRVVVEKPLKDTEKPKEIGGSSSHVSISSPFSSLLHS